MSYYFFNTSRLYIISMLGLFDNIYIQKSDGRQTKVPLVWGSKQRAVNVEESEGMNTATVIPKMSLSLVGMNFDTTRKTNKLARNPITYDSATNLRTFQYNSVPYNYDFMLQIKTKTLNDMNQIIEQILPYFNPSVSLNINEIPGQKATSISVISTSVDVAMDEDLGVEDEARFIIGTLNFTLKGNMYMPIKDQGIVEEIEINYGTSDIDETTNLITNII